MGLWLTQGYQRDTQIASSGIWTRVSDSISLDINRYAKHISKKRGKSNVQIKMML